MTTLALIGCGAIAEATYLPAIAAAGPRLASTWLVEPNRARGIALAKRFGLAPERVVFGHEELPAGVDLAINATPSHLHRSVTTALLQRGVSVLVEKPLAETAQDARAMIAEADGAGRLLSVNQSRRAGPSNRAIRELLRSGRLGRISRISWREGRPFDWPTQSGFNFRRPWQGRPRGVLLDIGVHVLDLLCWWLDIEPTVIDATLDGHGGPEASAAVSLDFAGAAAEIQLSYLAKLKNEVLIEGAAGAIRASTADYDSFELRTGSGDWRTVRASGSTDAVKNTGVLIDNVLAAIAGHGALAIPAAQALPALDVIDDVYRRGRAMLSQCYVEHLAPQMTPAPLAFVREFP